MFFRRNSILCYIFILFSCICQNDSSLNATIRLKSICVFFFIYVNSRMSRERKSWLVWYQILKWIMMVLQITFTAWGRQRGKARWWLSVWKKLKLWIHINIIIVALIFGKWQENHPSNNSQVVPSFCIIYI